MDFYIQRMEREFIYAMLFALLDSANNNSKYRDISVPLVWAKVKCTDTGQESISGNLD